MKNRAKFRALRALAAFFVMATPLYAESCALAHGGYGGSAWQRCPKAKQCDFTVSSVIGPENSPIVVAKNDPPGPG